MAKRRRSDNPTEPVDTSKAGVDAWIADAERKRSAEASLAVQAQGGKKPPIDADIPVTEWIKLHRTATLAQMRRQQDTADVTRARDDIGTVDRLVQEQVNRQRGYDEQGRPLLYTPMKADTSAETPPAPPTEAGFSFRQNAMIPLRGTPEYRKARLQQLIVKMRSPRTANPRQVNMETQPMQPVEGSAPTGGGGYTQGGHYVTAEEIAAARTAARRPVAYAKERQKPWLDLTDTTIAPPGTSKKVSELSGDPHQGPSLLNINKDQIARMERAAQGLHPSPKLDMAMDPDLASRLTGTLGDTGYFEPATARAMLAQPAIAKDNPTEGLRPGDSPNIDPDRRDPLGNPIIPGVLTSPVVGVSKRRVGKSQKEVVVSRPIQSKKLVGPAFKQSESGRRKTRRGSREMSANAAAKALELNEGTNREITRLVEELPFGQQRRPEGSMRYQTHGFNPDYMDSTDPDTGVPGTLETAYVDAGAPSIALLRDKDLHLPEGFYVERTGDVVSAIDPKTGATVHTQSVGSHKSYVQPGELKVVNRKGLTEEARQGNKEKGIPKGKPTRTIRTAGTRKGTTTVITQMSPDALGALIDAKEADKKAAAKQKLEADRPAPLVNTPLKPLGYSWADPSVRQQAAVIRAQNDAAREQRMRVSANNRAMRSMVETGEGLEGVGGYGGAIPAIHAGLRAGKVQRARAADIAQRQAYFLEMKAKPQGLRTIRTQHEDALRAYYSPGGGAEKLASQGGYASMVANRTGHFGAGATAHL